MSTWGLALLDEVRRVSDSVRNLAHTPLDRLDPCGSAWDVLWLGHCGDEVENLDLDEATIPALPNASQNRPETVDVSLRSICRASTPGRSFEDIP